VSVAIAFGDAARPGSTIIFFILYWSGCPAVTFANVIQSLSNAS
jgi:hypothetical protein